MNVIIQPKEGILNDLKPQFKSEHKKYRLMKYCLIQDVDGGKLIFNNLVKSLVWIKNSEYENLIEDWDIKYDYVNFLLKNYFVVPEDFNEYDIVNQLRNKRMPVITDNWLEHPTGFTILTTTQCNARCFYCYENPIKNKKPMTKKTAKSIVKYIQRVSPTKNIKLRWFGGEPLFNYEIIDYICERLTALGYQFKSSIISNGYLFDQEMCKKAKYLWNVNSVQITLDGTAEVYNKTKKYIYKDDPNPFETVLNNIKTLLDLNISTSIRMNCDKHNADDLKDLVKYLGETFKDVKHLNVYAYPLFELNGFTRTPEYRKEVFAKLEEIDAVIDECGFNIIKPIDKDDIRCVHCMVDTGQDVLISTEGELGLCEHYITEDFWGHIDKPELKDWSVINSWREYSEPAEVCKTCPIYPTCLKSKKCPDCNICDENWYEREIRQAKISVVDYYNKWKNGNTNNNNCNISKNCNTYQGEKCNKHMVSVYTTSKDNSKCEDKKNKKWYNKLFKWL